MGMPVVLHARNNYFRWSESEGEICEVQFLCHSFFYPHICLVSLAIVRRINIEVPVGP